MRRMRLGVFGGSFNPVHYGHLLLAECCREHCRLDEVWFMPVALPPHKPADELIDAADRVAMLELAVAGHDRFRVSTLEIDRGGMSYTVDTLEALAAQVPARQLYLLLGADSLRDLPQWRNPQRICQLALPVVVRRAGLPVPDVSVLAPLTTAARLAEIAQAQVEMPGIELASRELRHRVALGQSIRYRVPRAVEQYIAERGLYRTGPRSAG